jgi:S1-C subfamily serine protease
MDMEHLSKSQIVLLTLLVSFVTSIATGIVTVSLMDQAPPVVTQTVGRVIEKTVETVMPVQAGQPAAAAKTIVTQEKTVIVSESEQIAKAVERVNSSVVRVFTSTDDPAFLGLGVVIDSGGTVITDTVALDERPEATVVLHDGTRIRVFVVERDAKLGVAYMKASTSTESQLQKPIQWKPVSIATNKPALGASVVAISGRSVSRIGNGLVTALPQSESGIVFDTNIDNESIMRGSPLIDTSGNLVGVSTGIARTSFAQGFLSATELLPKKPAQP